MGMLDIFKKKKETTNIEQPKVENVSPYNVQYRTDENGNAQIDFYEKNADFKQFYDTTRLIIQNNPNSITKKCLVSWYGYDDAVMFDKNNKEISRRTNYRSILADINIDLLQKDPNYCEAVMKNLLSKDRVEKYLNEGLKENPNEPCGKYVGGIGIVENRYKKYFDRNKGMESHYSQEMKDKRENLRIRQEAQKMQEIERRKEQIAKLQQELDEMSK